MPLTLRLHAFVCMLAVGLIPHARAADAATDPALSLKLARDLTAPLRETRARPGAAVPVAPAPPREDRAVFLRADMLEGKGNDHVEASGHVELRTRSETVLADWLRYDFDQGEIWGKGNVLLRRGIDWVTGPEAKYKPDTETGFFTRPRYFIGEIAGRGTAREVRFTGPDHYEASDTTYTTCVAPREDWYLRMDELEVDEARKVGVAHHAWVYFMQTPIAYTPWLSFPLSDERKSGFLAPLLGSTGIRGFELATPYYFNLAPNYDATLTPRVMTKRGLQLGAQARYLFTTAAGEADVEDLPKDHVTNTQRYALAWKHNQTLDAITPGFAAYWNLNKVSDDTYFSDLADRIAITSQTTLPREGGFAYTRGPWSLLAREQSFQTLQDPNAPPVGKPYNRIPQVQAVMRDVDWSGLTFAGTGEYVRFANPALQTGQRMYAYPTLSWSRQGAAWFVTARGGLHARHYDLDQPVEGQSTFDYLIPIASLDTGLVYERDATLLGQKVVQTLEPRAFYVYIPYRDQHRIPAFDTAVDDYNFNQLFSENRYLGNDRIGDANQLTLAVTSRFIDPATGAERLRMALGQRFYFENQLVTLSEPPRSASTSDVLLLAEGRLSDAWSLAGLMQYNFDQSRSERFDVSGRYTPAPGKALSASYRYTRQFLDPTSGQNIELKQFDIAGQWPVRGGWTVLGRWNYSLADRKTLEAVAGVEYNADCWVVRIVGQRLTTTTQTAATSVYLQLELTGLARIGTNPLEVLRRSVPGYVKTNDTSLAPRDRGDVYPEF
ncbi:MAG TPA: LPS-assembly protein LptD [Casimicrobiaceae bacterium]|nr:LPS-assembly protein LptD [Casimicrobiaceae bacterium]